MAGMSLESMLDQERKDVLALLEGKSLGRARSSAGSLGSALGTARDRSPLTTPRSPVRSMLDIGEDKSVRPGSVARSMLDIGEDKPVRTGSVTRSMLDIGEDKPARTGSVTRSMLDIGEDKPARTGSATRSMLDIGENKSVRHGSVAGTNGGATATATAPTPKPTRQGKVRSMLDLDTPPPPGASLSAQPSPMLVNHRSYNSNGSQHRSLSDTASRPADFGPRSNVLETSTEPSSAYQFSGILPTNPGGPVLPKRNTQAGKKNSLPSAMSEVVRGGDISVFGSRGDRGHNQSIAIGAGKSQSPHNRLGVRSSSPHTSKSLSPEPKAVATLDNGKMINLDSAYRKLSDANLARSGGGLSSLGKTRRRTNSDGYNTRLEKDYVPIDGDDVVDSSDDDHRSSDEDRGRKGQVREIDTAEGKPTTLGMGRAAGPRPEAKSLLAAAEEERAQIAASYKIRSLIEPAITVTSPSGSGSGSGSGTGIGTKLKSSKPGIHPNTSFDEGATGLNTPADSDTEADLTDIRRAQRLSVNMTPIVSTPNTARCVRTLFRGDFSKMQQEAHDNQRRVRKYLVATDLSDEAAHALEWTIGTVLRDGDTLLAIYCVNEELGIDVANDDDHHTKEQATPLTSATKSTTGTPVLAPVASPGPLGPTGFRLETDSANASPMGRKRDKAEQDRYRAVQDITDRVSKLLRKTKLQVKVVIEVIHCKSPKHLITEVIDYISPTLVILGSRGRSALKGVILGSFSNYLVTKSSVPVMVARKRLRKHTKYKRPAIKLSNNLHTPVKSLGLERARID